MMNPMNDLINPIPEKSQLSWTIENILTLFLVIGTVFISGALGITQLARLIPGMSGSSGDSSVWLSILLTLLESVTIIGGVYLFALRRRGWGWSKVGLRLTRLVWWIIAVLLSFFLIPLSGLVAGAVQLIRGSALQNTQLPFIAPEGFNWSGMIGMVILGGILAPFAEELLFRGVLYQWLRQRWGVKVGILTSALVFAVMHGDWAVGAAAFVLGAVMAWIYEVSESLWPAVIIHVLNNSLKILLLYFLLATGININGGNALVHLMIGH
jgi:membrane protease YdiL (CAAX protease family)